MIAGTVEGPAEDWKPYAVQLGDRLTRDGILTDPALHRAVVDVPRHLFVPTFLPSTSSGYGPPVTSRTPGYLRAVYSDQTLVTRLAEHHGGIFAVSSSTAPGLMLRMLHELDLLDAMRVLEIGTGTGYNAALLCERLGDRLVCTVDVDPDVTTTAWRHLKAAGYDPVAGCRDGQDGYPERAPFDRIIATVSFPRVPWAWVEQTAPGGLILADLRPPGALWTGALAKLTVDNGSASGHLLPCRAGFMPARHGDASGYPEPPALDKTRARRRATAVSGEALLVEGLGLMVWARLPGLIVFPGADEVTLIANRSWATVSRRGVGPVEFGGSEDVWEVVETTRAAWLGAGSPTVERFGLTVTADEQTLWLDRPDNHIGSL
ncbi:methyltransferase domain-containing protein [Spirillospora sp. NPDC049652]